MKRLSIIGIIILLITSGCGAGVKKGDQEGLQVVTSFYPVYLMAKELTAGVSGISLTNMAQPQAGCLHDYTLTTRDMQILDAGDVLMLNGGGMEGFLTGAMETFPTLRAIDTSLGISLGVSDHDHSAEEGGNGHLWLSPTLAQQQVTQMVDAFCGLLPEATAQFEENGGRLIEKLSQLEAAGHDLGGETEIPVAIFHEGFDYFGAWVGFDPVVEIFVEENETSTAQTLAQAVEQAKEAGVQYFLAAEDEGKVYAELLAAECGGQVLILDPLTTGDLETGDYIGGMTENLRRMSLMFEKEVRE